MLLPPRPAPRRATSRLGLDSDVMSGLLAEDRVQLCRSRRSRSRSIPHSFCSARLPPPATGTPSPAATGRVQGSRSRCSPARERMDGHVVLAHVVQTSSSVHWRRVQLHDRAVVGRSPPAGYRRPAHWSTQAGDRIHAAEISRQRLHLAHVQYSSRCRPSGEEVRTVPVDEPLQLGCVRGRRVRASLVALAQRFDQLEGLGRQPLVSIEKKTTFGSIRWAMSIATSPSERRGSPVGPRSARSPIPGQPRLLALELDRQLAGFEIIQQFCRAHAATSLPVLRARARPEHRAPRRVATQNARKPRRRRVAAAIRPGGRTVSAGPTGPAEGRAIAVSGRGRRAAAGRA